MVSMDNINPVVTIITIVRNGQNCIERTIKSVIEQDYKNIEYVVIDGNSIDDTGKIISLYRDYINVFISEPDKGISDAFNKGLRNSKGEWVMFLNCGDYLLSNNIISAYVKSIQENVGLMFCYAMTEIGVRPVAKDYESLSDYRKCLLHHQTFLAARWVYNKYGGYDIGLKLRMDYDYLCRVVNKVNGKIVPVLGVMYEPGGVSSRYFVRFWIEGLYVIYRNKKTKKHIFRYFVGLMSSALRLIRSK